MESSIYKLVIKYDLAVWDTQYRVRVCVIAPGGYTHARTHYSRTIDIKKVYKQLNVVYGTIRYERCSRNPLSGPLLFIYNNFYLSYIY